ncbi:hypothetical protein [Paraburkholderia caledonica]|uniref:Uncharacterized protein n=1 Tax=Paraburkholderia caledonica TaxID=134536 RepID=A0AB73IPD1_9BURK|nr:hypothetical protein [Paraburkholderia caledonica]
MSALKIGEEEALELLAKVPVSSQRVAMSETIERDEIHGFSFALQEMLDEHREATHALDTPPAKPVVIYKKRRRMVPDVEPLGVD